MLNLLLVCVLAVPAMILLLTNNDTFVWRTGCRSDIYGINRLQGMCACHWPDVGHTQDDLNGHFVVTSFSLINS